MRTVHQKAQFVLWYAELKSVVAVQRKWRSLHPGEKPPTDKALNRWMNQFKGIGTDEKQKSSGRPIHLVLFKLQRFQILSMFFDDPVYTEVSFNCKRKQNKTFVSCSFFYYHHHTVLFLLAAYGSPLVATRNVAL